jgi:hypothetical protein
MVGQNFTNRKDMTVHYFWEDVSFNILRKALPSAFARGIQIICTAWCAKQAWRFLRSESLR